MYYPYYSREQSHLYFLFSAGEKSCLLVSILVQSNNMCVFYILVENKIVHINFHSTTYSRGEQSGLYCLYSQVENKSIRIVYTIAVTAYTTICECCLHFRREHTGYFL